MLRFCLVSFIFFNIILWAISCKNTIEGKDINVNVTESKNYTDTTKYYEPMDLDFIMGKFDPTSHTDFVEIDTKYADRSGLYLQKEAYISFVKMYNAALKDGVSFVIKSATRNFDYQKGIWERKWKGETTLSNGVNLGKSKLTNLEKAKMILEYSSMPGSSRHHWGTDIDLNAFNNAYFEEGEGAKVYNWLVKNASDYGFCRPYSAKGDQRPYGYNDEKWHWS